MANKTTQAGGVMIAFAAGLGGLLLYQRSAENAFNGYFEQVRPHLDASRECFTRYDAWTKTLKHKDRGIALQELETFVKTYTRIRDKLVAVHTDHPEIGEMKVHLDGYARHRLAFLEATLKNGKQEASGEGRIDARALLKQSKTEIARFQELRTALFAKYRLKQAD